MNTKDIPCGTASPTSWTQHFVYYLTEHNAQTEMCQVQEVPLPYTWWLVEAACDHQWGQLAPLLLQWLELDTGALGTFLLHPLSPVKYTKLVHFWQCHVRTVMSHGKLQWRWSSHSCMVIWTTFRKHWSHKLNWLQVWIKYIIKLICPISLFALKLWWRPWRQ